MVLPSTPPQVAATPVLLALLASSRVEASRRRNCSTPPQVAATPVLLALLAPSRVEASRTHEKLDSATRSQPRSTRSTRSSRDGVSSRKDTLPPSTSCERADVLREVPVSLFCWLAPWPVASEAEMTTCRRLLQARRSSGVTTQL